MSDYSYAAPQQTRRPGAGLAITALVLGILAVLLCWTVIGGVLLGLVALVLGFVAAGRARRGTGSGRGMAIAGVVLGVLGLLLSVALVAIGVSFLNSSEGKNLQQCLRDANGDQVEVQRCRTEFQRNLEDGS